jgi:SAM-dependent methyltransferase
MPTVSPYPPVSDPLALLHPGTGALLDVGCNVGDLLAAAAERGVRSLAGMDVNAAAVATARERLRGHPDAAVVTAEAYALPFRAGQFQLAFCLEVLEHVPAQMRRQTLEEIHRVLAPGGRLVLSVPHAGAFAWADPANLRFRAPGLYRAASRLVGGAGREAGFAEGESRVEPHHHFSVAELQGLMAGLFHVEQLSFRGALVEPLTHALAWPFYRRGSFGHPLLRALHALENADRSRDWGERWGYGVLLVACRD